MRKFLKALTFGSVSLAALVASAEVPGPLSRGPAVSFGGSIQAAALAVNQKIRSTKEVTFQTNGNLTASVSGTTDNNLTYGGMAIISLDRSKFATTDGLSEVYMYVNHDALGNLRFGDTSGVENTMMFNSGDVLTGLRGRDINKYFNITRGVDLRESIEQINDTATKVAYTSPTVHGFQLGLSFTPNSNFYGRYKSANTKSASSSSLSNNQTTPYAQNHLATALSYNHSFSRANVGIYGVYSSGKGHSPSGTGKSVNNVNAWQVGFLGDVGNWQLGASYFDNGKSLVKKGTNWTNTKGFGVAAGYDFAHNMNASLGVTHTERKVTGGKAKGDVLVASVDYLVMPGLEAFFEVDQVTTKAPTAYVTGANVSSADLYANYPTTNTNNHGTAFILGSRVRF
jgi:hypothetical protein